MERIDLEKCQKFNKCCHLWECRADGYGTYYEFSWGWEAPCPKWSPIAKFPSIEFFCFFYICCVLNQLICVWNLVTIEKFWVFFFNFFLCTVMYTKMYRNVLQVWPLVAIWAVMSEVRPVKHGRQSAVSLIFLIIIVLILTLIHSDFMHKSIL